MRIVEIEIVSGCFDLYLFEPHSPVTPCPSWVPSRMIGNARYPLNSERRVRNAVLEANYAIRIQRQGDPVLTLWNRTAARRVHKPRALFTKCTGCRRAPSARPGSISQLASVVNQCPAAVLNPIQTPGIEIGDRIPTDVGKRICTGGESKRIALDVATGRRIKIPIVVVMYSARRASSYRHTFSPTPSRG